MVPTPQDLEDARNDWLAELREQEKRKQLLIKHPRCEDPDHPGCALCMPVVGAPRKRCVLTLPKKITGDTS